MNAIGLSFRKEGIEKENYFIRASVFEIKIPAKVAFKTQSRFPRNFKLLHDFFKDRL